VLQLHHRCVAVWMRCCSSSSKHTLEAAACFQVGDLVGKGWLGGPTWCKEVVLAVVTMRHVGTCKECYEGCVVCSK
jgi:hypothetical protein